MQSVKEAINFLLVNDLCLFCKDELFYFDENIIQVQFIKENHSVVLLRFSSFCSLISEIFL